jgi:small conductance mechanosensitive channel
LTTQHQDGGDLQRSARIRTLLPLLRKALFIFLSLMVVLISLSEIGVDIAPLLAGAGVIGLAIGFGSQKLVQDVITGVFMLVEDALSVGDVVEVAGTGGVVEDMSIRSIRLRDLSGNVHTIPFSSVGTVTNMTKDYSYYLLDIGVDYRQDPDQVMEVCKSIVDEMREEPAFAYDILEPLDVLGVDQFAESAIIIKARIKTRPIKQWAVGREFNRRMKKRFDELGIEIPYPHRTVYIANEKNDQSATLRVRFEGDAFPVQSTAQEPPQSVSPSRKRRTRKPEVARALTNPPDAASE